MLPFNLATVFFVGFELCYYLLIAQTGVVEVFHSNILQISPLPIGGMIGSYLSSHLNIKKDIKVYTLLLLQTLMTLFYPKLNPATLFLLGCSVGGMAPLIINQLKEKNSFELLLSLGVAYTVGTALFTTEAASRSTLGILLSLCTLLCYFFANKNPQARKKSFVFKNITAYPLFLMAFWVFLDSALFETLSRDVVIPIWRGGYTLEIISFHILGVIFGIFFPASQYQKSLVIIVLFALSYLFYFLHEAWMLSLVYPFVISYYNVAILQSLLSNLNLKSIGIYMIFIGWGASGAGLFVALQQWIIYIPLCFLAMLLYIINQKSHYKISKEVYHV